MVTKRQYLMGRDLEFPITMEMLDCLQDLLKRIHILEEEYGLDLEVESGYRPDHYNTDAGGSQNSTHLHCMGIDIKDHENRLKTYILTHPEVLDKCDLYMEDVEYTRSWTHLDTRKRTKRIFKPY